MRFAFTQQVVPPFPLERLWERLAARAADLPAPEPTGHSREGYLDLAEVIVREALAGRWQRDDGMIVDPFRGEPDVHATARFIGAVGNLIRAGRCLDATDSCAAAYDALWRKLGTVDPTENLHYPEFWVKEMMFAHPALARHVDQETIARWEEKWNSLEAEAYYGCFHDTHLINNCFAFAASSEQLKGAAGFTYRREIVDRAVDFLLPDITEHGMYADPGDPVIYGLVVGQLLDLVLHAGYDGPHAARIREVCRRCAATLLCAQSVTGQMPFGGRSNQFHFNEAQFAVFCETQAAGYLRTGDEVAAGILKRAARRAVAMTRPWILMKPLRQLKQGFDPRHQHGVDSRGFYSVYSLLAASLLGAAYHLAEHTEHVVERATPAEIGGYAFGLWPEFHKVFATCGGYHVEIDTKADHEKDATGLCRVHRRGCPPETALSCGITAKATYAYDVPDVGRPTLNAAIGPEWKDRYIGKRQRLADCQDVVRRADLTVVEEREDALVFRILYEGNLGNLRTVEETYRVTTEGIEYRVRIDDPGTSAHLLLPLIVTDGLEPSGIVRTANGFTVSYRGWSYRVVGDSPSSVELTDDPPAANRNAVYRFARLDALGVRLSLAPCP